MAGEWVVKQEGEKRRLVINFRGMPFPPDVAQYAEAMRHVVDTLQQVEADELVLSEYYERIYDEDQTRMLRSVADLVNKFEIEGVWSPSHLGKPTDEGRVLQARHAKILEVVTIAHSDPFKAYLQLLAIVKDEAAVEGQLAGEARDSHRIYLGTLNFMRTLFEEAYIIQRLRRYIAQVGSIPAARSVYVPLFEVAIKPAFIGSRIFFGGTESLELVDQYEVLGARVQIFKHPEKVELLYYLNPPEYTLPPDKYYLLERTKEVVAGQRPPDVGFMDMAQARRYFHKIYISTIADIAAKSGINLTVEEKSNLATIVSRYTIGYGILEILLSDRQLTDVYIDSPLGARPIYMVHSRHGQCVSNIIYSDDEARSMVSRMRALSGRPFDEAHCVLDYDLVDLQTRVAVIGKPMALDGIAFAFRLHKETPWTLPQFLDNKMFTPLAAGLFSYMVDAQASQLIVGSRGSGKTSFLQSLMLEIPQNLRIIVQEDTQELPVPQMKKLGFNIQRLKTRPPLGGITEGEVSAEDALRTALRLGDSVLIVGEVRSTEAKALYEAMRVGAVGNVVMGTIHGESAYSIWDRVVNDLGVPTTSFKATDFCIVGAPIRFKGSLKRQRRIIEVTEVRKHWKEDPSEENGFLDWMMFDAGKDDLTLFEDNLRESEWIQKVQRIRGNTFDELWKEITTRGASKQYLVDVKRKLDIPRLLEADNSVRAHSKLTILAERQREEHGSVDHEQLLSDWKKWVDEVLVAEQVQLKRLEKTGA